MTDLSFELAHGVRASLAPDVGADRPIFWFIEAVSLGVSPSHPAHEALRRHSVGSSTETGDELRFSKRSGALVSGYLDVPETNGDWETWRPVLERSEGHSGALLLITKEPFVLPETDIRVLDPKGHALMCVREEVDPEEIDARHQILSDFCLLCSRGKYCGWLLSSPLGRLCPSEEDLLSSSATSDRAAEGAAPRLVSRLFEIVNEDTLDELHDSDEELRRELEALDDAVKAQLDGVGARALSAKITDLLDRWFSQA